MKNKRQGISLDKFEDFLLDEEVFIVDIRTQSDFIAGHIPTSIFIGLNGRFDIWSVEVIKNLHQGIVLVGNEDQVIEAYTQLAAYGFDNVLGHLEGGMKTWKASGRSIDTITSIEATELADRLVNDEEPIVVDVRKLSEYENGHIVNANNCPLRQFNDYLKEMPSAPFYVHCGGGYRSVVAISILKSKGIHSAIDIAGGFHAIKQKKSIKVEMKKEA